jgi:hypothetical protein
MSSVAVECCPENEDLSNNLYQHSWSCGGLGTVKYKVTYRKI